MPVFMFRLTAGSDTTSTVINQIASLEGIESVEEIADLMPHMDDSDSSSAGLTDHMGPGIHPVRVEAGNDTVIRRALALAEASAFDLGAVFEVVDEERD